jgi:protein SCO1/2
MGPTRARASGLLAAILATIVFVAAGCGGAAAKPHVAGERIDRAVPRLPLQDERGRTTSLAAFRGKVVVLAPFLTLCHEVCPLTTGAFEAMQRAVDRAGLGDQVTFAEVSVDPWRDTPARLSAFARTTGARFHLLTGTRAQLTRFWRFFGVAFFKTPEGKPPDTDWLTGKPLTFDVSHTDGLFLLDANGHERILDIGMPNVGGRLSATLKRLLNDTGRRNLAHPQAAWTVRQALDDIGSLLGKQIPE